jgi:NEDD8-activating enzyme E1
MLYSALDQQHDITTLNRYFGKIQDKDDDYYMQFALVICGLDSVEARRWMNATLVNLVEEDEPDTIKPMIDGGTEGSPSCSRFYP